MQPLIIHLTTHIQPIQTRVRAIFDVIVTFQQKQTSMYTDCLEEVDRRALIQQQMEERTEEVCVCVCVCACVCAYVCVCVCVTVHNLSGSMGDGEE